MNPELEEFRRQIEQLRNDDTLRALQSGDAIHLGRMSLEDVDRLARHEVAYYFLVAAAGLNRTSLRRAQRSAEARVVSPKLRQAFAIRSRLPVRASFGEIAAKAVALRSSDLNRKRRGEIEQLFRDRLDDEGIPIVMSPPVRKIPGLLISERKPDGVYPDPATGRAPLIYLEVKNIRRVADDIQKRLYEIAEASLEMKLTYGNLTLHSLRAPDIAAVVEGRSRLRAELRAQITSSPPVVVALLLCSAKEAERYRKGAEAFIDRIFFTEEIDACLAFLRATIQRLDPKEDA